MFRHRFDPSAAIAGLLFLGLAALYLTRGLSVGRSLWIAPAVLLGLGAIGVLRVVFRARRADRLRGTIRSE